MGNLVQVKGQGASGSFKLADKKPPKKRATAVKKDTTKTSKPPATKKKPATKESAKAHSPAKKSAKKSASVQIKQNKTNVSAKKNTSKAVK